MQCLRTLVLFAIHLALLVTGTRAARSSAQPFSLPSSPSHRRPFAMAGFHEVQAPRLGRPDATPPPPPPVIARYQVPEQTVNGFKPILGPRIPIQRRRQPASLDYGTDIITIYDVKPQIQKVNNDTLLKTVSSSFQVKREDEKKAGRVFDDVIYDLPVDTQDFKPQESSVFQKTVKRDRLNGWRRIA